MSHYQSYLQGLEKAKQDLQAAKERALAAEKHWQEVRASAHTHVGAALQKDFPGVSFSGTSGRRWIQRRRGKELTLFFIYDHDENVYCVSPDDGDHWYDSPVSWRAVLEAHPNVPAFAAFLKQLRSGV